jgi:hypothetical protein
METVSTLLIGAAVIVALCFAGPRLHRVWNTEKAFHRQADRKAKEED